MTRNDNVDTARPIAPEDLRRGMYLAVLRELREDHPFMFDLDTREHGLQPVRMTWLPDSVLPLRVADVCLPFVFVQQPDGRHGMLDVRRIELARLSDRYGRRAFGRLRDEASRRSAGKDGDAASGSGGGASGEGERGSSAGS